MNDLEIGNVTVSDLADGNIVGVQVDVYGEESSGCPSGETHQPYGFYARPLDPTPEGSCYVSYQWRGDELHAWPSYDPRVTPKLPALKKGASVQHNGLGSFGHFEHNDQDGTYTLYVPVAFDGNGTPTKAHVLTIGLDGNGKRSITLLHADGMHISMLEGGKNGVVVANKANDAWVEVNDDGVSINGNVKISGNLGAGPLASAWFAAVQAALASLGQTVPLPPPVSLTA